MAEKRPTDDQPLLGGGEACILPRGEDARGSKISNRAFRFLKAAARWFFVMDDGLTDEEKNWLRIVP